jgi:hypothetical protein
MKQDTIKAKGKAKKAIRVFLDIISFNTPQAIVFNLSVIILLLAVLPTPVLEDSPSKCVFRNIILPLVFSGHCPSSGFFAGCKCPACGLTTGVSRLLHGDLASALASNKMSIAVLLVMIFLLGINIIKIVKHLMHLIISK